MAMSIEDAFDAISNWEEEALAEGEEMGIDQGREMGVEEGKALGITKGLEIGSEIGFYQGCFHVWQQMLANEQTASAINDRAKKAITNFGKLVQSYELENKIDEDMMQRLLHIRAKFKIICSLLGLKDTLKYSQEDVDAHKNMSF